MAHKKPLLFKSLVVFALCAMHVCSAIMVSPSSKTAAAGDSKLVKRSGYEFEGNSVHSYNGDRTRSAHKAQMQVRGQNRLDSDTKTLKGESSEERANFFGSQQEPPPAYGGYSGPVPYASASGPGPSYGASPYGGNTGIGGGGGGPYGGVSYGGSPYGGGNHIDSSPGDDYHYEHHPKKHGHHHKSLAIKALLVPLVGVALLGVATAFVSNPILLQLGVITGKRRRRDVNVGHPEGDLRQQQAEELQRKLDEMAALERYMTELPKEEAATQEKMLLANYLTCSGIASANQTSVANCLERLTCELHHPESTATELEKHVMGIVTSEILTNEFIPPDVKHRVKVATSRGADSGDCSDFPCYELETHSP